MRQIGPYQIIDEIGTGGMGTVYRAMQPTSGRIVALKVLPASHEHNPESVARFRREVNTAVRLRHPDIVDVVDASLSHPPYYVALEFLDGGTLAQRLERGPLPLVEALRVLSQIGDALSFAHEHGVIHRDVKPANIMFGRGGRAVLTDFGVVQDLGLARLTMDGSKFGTPQYMSPEQARGRKLDHRTDFYALGTVFYEMLVGRAPFVGEPDVVMRQVAKIDPIPPSRLRTGLSPQLDAVVLRALAKEPAQRFQSMSAMCLAAQRSCAACAGVAAIAHSAPMAQPQLGQYAHVARPASSRPISPQAGTRHQVGRHSRLVLLVLLGIVLAAALCLGVLAAGSGVTSGVAWW
jgi:serine/threonine-protein kinase